MTGPRIVVTMGDGANRVQLDLTGSGNGVVSIGAQNIGASLPVLRTLYAVLHGVFGTDSLA